MEHLGGFPSLTDISGQLVNYEVYEGNNKYIGIATVDLPKVEFETVDIKGTGIHGTVSMPTYYNTGSMTSTLHWRSLSRAAHSLLQQKRHSLTMYGAVQHLDLNTGEIDLVQVKIEMQVLPKSLTAGKFETSALMESESEFEVIALKIMVDREVMLEIDKFNYKYDTYDGMTWAQKLTKAFTDNLESVVTNAIS